jgi:hypothetical protein
MPGGRPGRDAREARRRWANSGEPRDVQGQLGADGGRIDNCANRDTAAARTAAYTRLASRRGRLPNPLATVTLSLV